MARLARPALRRRNVTGIVLLYAHDKVASLSYPWRSRRVNRTGPHVCHCDFGPRTFKLQLNASIPYLYRNAAELFLAAHAPTTFTGNAYSTFAKGVALMRAATPPQEAAAAAPSDAALAAGRRPSFAFDCAQAEEVGWKPRDVRSTGRIVRLHPGFELLRPIDDDAERSEGALPQVGLARHGIGQRHSHCGASGVVMTAPKNDKCTHAERNLGHC